jgi:hypothetical protein
MLVQCSRECTLPYLSTGISNLLQPAQAEVVLGQRSTYLASWVMTMGLYVSSPWRNVQSVRIPWYCSGCSRDVGSFHNWTIDLQLLAEPRLNRKTSLWLLGGTRLLILYIYATTLPSGGWWSHKYRVSTWHPRNHHKTEICQYLMHFVRKDQQFF